MRLRISNDGLQAAIWLVLIAVSSTTRTTNGWCSSSLTTATPLRLSSLAATADGKNRQQARPQFQQPKHSPKSGSKFAQPAFTTTAATEPTTTTTTETPTTKTYKVNKYGADSRIASLHKERLRTAGREGTKRYQSPNKVFLGNLDFTVTSSELEQWLSQQFSMPAPLLIKQCKIVQDWKTQQSKGYGFCVFSDPLYATVCLEKCNNVELKGRKLRVSAGYKKQPDPAIYVLKKQQKIKDREEAAIQRALDEAAGLVEPEQPKQPIPLDRVALQMLRRLDPDLIEDFTGPTEVYEIDDSVFDDDLMDDDDDAFLLDDGFDGVYVEDENDEDIPTVDENGLVMNREKRREAARKRKKKKVSNKGFGT